MSVAMTHSKTGFFRIPKSTARKSESSTAPRRAETLNTMSGDAKALVVVSKPGTYLLTADLIGEQGKAGIRIEADGVTLELNGYAVVGCKGSTDGITLSAAVAGVTVKNGTIRGWGRDGVDLGRAMGCTIRNLDIRSNAGVGLLLGTGVTISECTIDGGASGVGVATASAAK